MAPRQAAPSAARGRLRRHTVGGMVSSVAGILLAAGEGSRLGQPKALVELGGQTLAERGVALLRDGGADPVVVVTGAAPVDIPGVRIVHNPAVALGHGVLPGGGSAGTRTRADGRRRGDRAGGPAACRGRGGAPAHRRLPGRRGRRRRRLRGKAAQPGAHRPRALGRRDRAWRPGTPVRGHSCARTPNSSRSSNAATRAAPTTWTRRKTWRGCGEPLPPVQREKS